MPYKMNPQQYENVLALSAKERYSHFIGKAADWEQLWGLYNENKGWLTRVTPENIEYLSIWPHAEYAKNISKEYYPEYIEKEISLEDFMSNWLPELNSDNIKIGVFPDLEGNAWLMEANDLLQDLQDECAQYE